MEKGINPHITYGKGVRGLCLEKKIYNIIKQMFKKK